MSAFLGALGGGAIGSAIVTLVLESKRYDAELARARGKTQAATSAMGTGFTKFSSLAKAGAAAAALAVVAFAAKAVAAASDQEEALNKSNVVFGKASASVVAFAEKSAKALGISKTAALSAAAGFGNMLITAGLAEDAAASMSVKLVELAADMASFNNIDPTEALEKLRSGLAGEAEPLRVLGVQLSETRVKAEAYRSGIAKLGEELTDAQKVQARYNVILQDTGKQQGDFARTSDSAANQQRILAAQVQDLAAELGRSLLPALKLLLDGLNAIIAPIRAVVEIITTDAFERFAQDLEKAGLTAKQAAEEMRGLKAAMEESNASGRQLGGAMAILERRARQNAEEAEGWAKRQQAVAAELDRTSEAAKRTTANIARFARRSGESIEDFTKAVRGSTNFVEARWEELAGRSRVTANQIVRSFQRGLRDQARFADNVREFSDRVQDAFGGRVPKAAQEMIADLAQRGTEGAAILRGLANANEDQIRAILSAWRRGKEGPKEVLGILRDVDAEIRHLNTRTVTIPIQLDYSWTGSAGPGGAATVADALANELVKGQG